jgi:hypothetical protein
MSSNRLPPSAAAKKNSYPFRDSQGLVHPAGSSKYCSLCGWPERVWQNRIFHQPSVIRERRKTTFSPQEAHIGACFAGQ